tara:strand:+ start:558 stop:1001 length:444 start_codon:yes stop_codon:yes gene_type:complete
MKLIRNIFFVIIISLFSVSTYAEKSEEEIIKGRKSLFSKNYRTAKRVDILSKDLEFEDAKKYMLVMKKNYEDLLNYFPENTKEGFGTQSLPTIWENKDEFNALMQKSADDLIQLANLIEEADDIRGTLKKYMWKNCNACHSKFRKPH